MKQILIVSMLCIASTFFGLSVLIVGNKAWRDGRNRWWAARRRALEPGVDRFQRGLEATLPGALGGSIHRRDRCVLEQILLERIQTADAVEQARLSRAMDQLGYVDEYLPDLASRNWWSRATAAEKLGLAVARRAIDPLTAALRDDVAEVRFRAAKALGNLGGIDAVRSLIGALDQPDRWSTIRIADVLTSMGREVGDELAASFETLGPRARAAALDVLAAVGHVNIAPWMRERLGDPVADIRSRAANALGHLGDMEAGDLLTEALNDDEWPVRAMAAKAVGMILHLPAVPDLCNALRDREWWVRVNAAEALRVMGPVGLSALEGMLGDPDPYARHQALFMLEEAGVVDEQVDLLWDEADALRRSARVFVERAIAAGPTGRLAELSERHPLAETRGLLNEMLQQTEQQVQAAS